MNWKYKIPIYLFSAVSLSLSITMDILAQPIYYVHPVKQGFWSKLSMNELGWFGVEAYDNSHLPFFSPTTMGLEYPVESLQEHLFSAGILVGALLDTGKTGQPKIMKAVLSTEVQAFVPGVNSTFPVDTNHLWNYASILDLNEPNSAVSESDVSCAYTDSFHIYYGKIVNRHPLGVKVWQRSYAWARGVREPVLPIDFSLVNVGKNRLDSVYVGFSIWPSVGPLIKGYAFAKNVAGYWPELRTAYVYNPFDTSSTPIGFTLLETSRPLTQLQYFFIWWPESDPSLSTLIQRPSELYDYLRGVLIPNVPAIKSNQLVTDPGLYHLQFSFGPFETWAPGETLKVSLAFVCGHSLEFGADNVKDNARSVFTLYKREYKPPIVLPAPKLTVEAGDRQVLLRWGNAGSSTDPRNIWDDENVIASVYPPDHWRRINPPAGKTAGGRIFEGYRLYRSEDPSGTPNSFTLLREWDMVDSVGPHYEFDTGIESTYVDSNLHTGKTYWYAVTSFGIPDLHTIEYLDRDGSVKTETLFTPSAESSVLASRKRAYLPFSISHAANQVLVVPNPYRVDETYTYESGGWEGRERAWNENKRLIRFIHLPAKCTIRIYSLAGDVIATLNHDDPVRGDMDWNLISESNRAIASGVYLFTVESEFGKQVGKFVIIR